MQESRTNNTGAHDDVRTDGSSDDHVRVSAVNATEAQIESDLTDQILDKKNLPYKAKWGH